MYGERGHLQMTNLEINIAIAGVKGMATINGACQFNWAENISDAWELFEEMPHMANIFKREDGMFEVTCADEAYHGFADTAPLAIAKAYLKWKTK